MFGGESGYFFRTAFGPRFVDQFSNGIARESKVGEASLDSDTIVQVMKDAWLKSKGVVQDVEWHFFRSPKTNLAGPNPALRQALLDNGIKVVIHP